MHLKLCVLTLAVALVSSGDEGESTPSGPFQQSCFSPAQHGPVRAGKFKGFKGSFSRDSAPMEPLGRELEEPSLRPLLDPKLAASILKEVAAHRSILRTNVGSKTNFVDPPYGNQLKHDQLEANPEFKAKLAYLTDFINNPKDIKLPKVSQSPVSLKIRSKVKGVKGVKGDKGRLNEPEFSDGNSKMTNLKLEQLHSRSDADISHHIIDERNKEDFEPSSASDNLSILSEIEPLLRQTDSALMDSVTSVKKSGYIPNVNSIDRKGHEQSSYCIQHGNNLVSVMGKGLKANDQSLVCISKRPIQKIVVIVPVTETDASALGSSTDGHVKFRNITISLNDPQKLEQLFRKYHSEQSKVNAEHSQQLCSQFCTTRHEKGYKPPPPPRSVQSDSRHSDAPSPVDLGFALPQSPIQAVGDLSPSQTEESVQKSSRSGPNLTIVPLAESVPVAIVGNLNTESQPSRNVVKHIKRSFEGVDVSSNSDIQVNMYTLDNKFEWKNNAKFNVFFGEDEKIFITSDKLMFKGEVNKLCKYRDSNGKRNTFVDEKFNVYTSSADYLGDFTLAEHESSSSCNQLPARICLRSVELNNLDKTEIKSPKTSSAALEEIIVDEDLDFDFEDIDILDNTLEAKYNPVFSEDFQPGPVYLQKSMLKK